MRGAHKWISEKISIGENKMRWYNGNMWTYLIPVVIKDMSEDEAFKRRETSWALLSGKASQEEGTEGPAGVWRELMWLEFS